MRCTISLRRWSQSALLGGAALGLAMILWSSSVSAQEADPYPAMFRCAQSFAASLSTGDSSALASVTHPALLARINGALGAEAAKRRTYQCLAVGSLLGDHHGTAQLLARHPDGVEDVVQVTLKLEGGQWRVVGGPVGHSQY